MIFNYIFYYYLFIFIKGDWHKPVEESIIFLISSKENFFSFFSYLLNFFRIVLKNFDPSLFQNIILGVLAIFIPFAIVFLTEVLGLKNKKTEFEKLVFNYEVLGTKKLFWLSVAGIVFFSFFSGKDISNFSKLFALIIGGYFVRLYWILFRKILKYSEGEKSEFEISFLKNNTFLKFKNKSETDIINVAWNSFWLEKSKFNEKIFTEIFISHVDSAIKQRQFNLAMNLSESYVNNVEKRNNYLVGDLILPNIFKWNERFWNEQQLWLKNVTSNEKIKNQTYSFWNWEYFQNIFFRKVIKILLVDFHGAYQFFDCFKKYINKCETKYNLIVDEKEKIHFESYITNIIYIFSFVFFDNINKSLVKHDIWKQYYPKDWKVISVNSKNIISNVIFNNFLLWTQQRIFSFKHDKTFDKDLNEVLNGLFPDVHPTLFTSFLMLYFFDDVKTVIQNERNFYILNVDVTWSGMKSREQIREEVIKKIDSKRDETIKIIFMYFREWRMLKVFEEEIPKENIIEWEKYSELKKEEILNSIKKNKISKILNELNSPEIIEISTNNDRYEHRRIELIALMNEVLKFLSK